MSHYYYDYGIRCIIIAVSWVHCECVSMALFCIIFIQIQYMKGYFYSCTLWNWNYCVYCKYKWLKKVNENSCFVLFLLFKTHQFVEVPVVWNLLQFWNSSVLQFLVFDSKLEYWVFMYMLAFWWSWTRLRGGFSMVVRQMFIFLICLEFVVSRKLWEMSVFLKKNVSVFWLHALPAIPYWFYIYCSTFVLFGVSVYFCSLLSRWSTGSVYDRVSTSGPAAISVNTASAQSKLTSAELTLSDSHPFILSSYWRRFASHPNVFFSSEGAFWMRGETSSTLQTPDERGDINHLISRSDITWLLIRAATHFFVVNYEFYFSTSRLVTIIFLFSISFSTINIQSYNSHEVPPVLARRR